MGRFVSRAFAIFFVMLFIVTASLSACSYAFRDTLVNVETYKQMFARQNVYDDVIPYVIPAFLRESEDDLRDSGLYSIDVNDIYDFMSLEDWRAVSDELIPPQWLQTQTESALDALNQISQGDFSQSDAIVNVTQVVERLQGEAGERASAIIIDSAPDCSAEQVVQLRDFDSNSGEIFPLCHPPTLLLQNKATGVINRWFVQLGTALNQQANQRDVGIPEDIARLIYNLFQLDTQMSLLLLLCPLTLMGFIIVFAVRNLQGFGRWLGWTFILTGILTLLLIFTTQAQVFDSFEAVVSANNDIERFEAQIYAGFIRSIYTNASNTMLILAGGMIAVGFVLLAISLLGRSHNLIVPEGAMLVTPDGRVISTASEQRSKTKSDMD